VAAVHGMTELRILRPGDEAVLEAFLLPRVEWSMFLLGNLRTAGLLDRGQRFGGTYAAALEGGSIVATVAHYWNGNLVFQAPVHVEALWRLAVAASGRAIRGLIGPAEQVSLAEAGLALEAGSAQLDEREVLYSLALPDLLVPEALRAGRVRARRVEGRDRELLAHWVAGYSREALGEEDRPELLIRSRASAERLLAEARTWLLEADGTPVAMSSFNAALPEAVQVGGVWTPPQRRNRAYGRAVVAASLLAARAEGVQKAILFTGEANWPARRAYEALGFSPIGDYRLLLFTVGLVGSTLTGC
jgi:uncharacterized protein